MSSVFLTAAELKGKRPFPRCCVVCGSRKAKMVEASFTVKAGHRWSMMTGSVSVMRYLTTGIPLCSEHKGYFSKFQWMVLYIFLGVVAFFLFLIMLSVFCIMLLGPRGMFVIIPIAFLAVIALFGFIIFMMISSTRGVHASAITAEGMRLENVAREFARALADIRKDAGPEVEDVYFEEFSGGSRSRRYDDYDDYDEDDHDDYPRRRRRRR